MRLLGGVTLTVGAGVIFLKLTIFKLIHMLIGATFMETMGRLFLGQYWLFGPTGTPDDLITMPIYLSALGPEGYLVMVLISFILMLAGILILIHEFGGIHQFKRRLLSWI